VYCLTNATNAALTGHCFCRYQNDRIFISRPLAMIQEYSPKMGGVNVILLSRVFIDGG